MQKEYRDSHHGILMGLAKICGIVMIVYLFSKILIVIHGNHWSLIATPMGHWYLVEIIGGVLIPCILFLYGIQRSNLIIVRVAAVLTMIGIILNRLNISTFAYKWEEGIHFPSWQEVVVVFAVIFVQIWVFRWIIRRMPVYRDPPSWAGKH